MQFGDIPISKNTVIMGIGNPDRGDDAVGIFVSEELKKKGARRIFSCYEVPENYITKVCDMDPDTVVFIDAVNMNSEPGAIVIMDPADVSRGITTHNAGLDILADFIRNSCDAEIYLVAVQPAGLEGKQLTPRIRSAGEKIIDVLGEKLCTNQ